MHFLALKMLGLSMDLLGLPMMAHLVMFRSMWAQFLLIFGVSEFVAADFGDIVGLEWRCLCVTCW